MKRNRQFAIAVVLALMAVVPALAQNSRVYRDGNGWVEEITGSLPATRSLRVTTDIGSIRVNGGSDSDIKFVIRKHSYSSSEESARKAFQQFGVTATRRGDAAIIEGSWEERRGRRFNVEFQLTVPRNLQLVKLSSDGGGINVSGLSGKLEAETGGGEVHLDDVAASLVETGGGTINVGTASGELTLKTGGGNIRVVSTSAKLNAESGGGSVWVGKAAGAEVETGGGSIKVDSCSGSSRVTTGGGTIELGEVNGPVTMETGGGGIHLSSAKGPVRVETGGGSLELWKLYNGVRAETGGGSITAELLGSPQNPSSMETSAGDLTVYIASDVKLNVQAEIESAFGHKIYSDFPEVKITSEGGEYGPKTYTATGSLNGGGQVLKLDTNMGNIYIRRAKR
ncbi:MAG: DUF4097 family beta strand repeat-containing protein [Terriglobales bacterium]